MGGYLFRRLLTVNLNILLVSFGLIFLTPFSLNAIIVSEASDQLPSVQFPITDVPSNNTSAMLPDEQGLLGPEVFSPGLDCNDAVARYISYFQSPEGQAWLTDGMNHAEPFRDFIVAHLSAKGMPPELFYVVMIESTFHVDAVSRSGAAGLWQFMLNSVGNWMQHNEWLDERFDFWSSTKAGIEKLKENYQKFNDWPLALAAYNAGSGRIERLLKKTGAKTFWDLAKNPLLPPETREYVPQILAAAYVGSHPGRYGLPVNWNQIIEWDKIEVRTAIPLRKLETIAGIPDGILELGNAELRFDITPPGKQSHFIKVPHRYTQAIIEALNSEKVRLDYFLHTIEKGDTLFALCKKYSTNNRLILEYNPGLSPKFLKIGRKLIIPLLPETISAEENTKDIAS